MGESVNLLRGVVKGGVIVPVAGATLPEEGVEVEITVLPLKFTPEEQAEFDMWDKASDEAWAMIDQWEKEEGTSYGEIARDSG